MTLKTRYHMTMVSNGGVSGIGPVNVYDLQAVKDEVKEMVRDGFQFHENNPKEVTVSILIQVTKERVGNVS